jgi:RNA polymerase sigma-70 factor (ECF subfamily)
MRVMVGDLAECYDKHGDALLRFAATQVGASDADDVLSAAMLGVLQHGLADVEDARAYLYRAVANASLKHWRGLGRRRRRDLSLVPPAATADEVGSDPRADAMGAALARLSVQQRAVVHLTYWEDLTPSVVAARLGVSEGTVRRQLARARDRLRKVLDERG